MSISILKKFATLISSLKFQIITIIVSIVLLILLFYFPLLKINIRDFKPKTIPFYPTKEESFATIG